MTENHVMCLLQSVFTSAKEDLFFLLDLTVLKKKVLRHKIGYFEE